MPTTAQQRVQDPILTTIAQGYVHPEHIAHHLFPRVPVRTAGGKIIEFDKSDFKLYNTRRAPGTPFKRVTFGHEGKPFALENHGLEAPVPREHMRDASQMPGIDLARGAIGGVQAIQSLSVEVQAAEVARNPDAYGANNKLALAGTDQWSDYAESDPISDINDAREAVRSEIGLYPNTIEIPGRIFNVLKEHPLITAKIKYSSGGVVTADLLKQVFDVDHIVIGKAIYMGDDDRAHDAWGNDVVLAYVPPQVQTTLARDMAQPSYGYTYAMEGHPLVEVPYWEDASKSWVYGVGYERAPVMSGMSAGFLLKNVIPAPAL